MEQLVVGDGLVSRLQLSDAMAMRASLYCECGGIEATSRS